MSYVKPDAVLDQMVQAGATKARLAPRDLLVRGFLSGALLGFATTLAFTATLQTHVGLVGGLVFPVGFVMIVLLGLELVTGNFALLPLAGRGGQGVVIAVAKAILCNWMVTLGVVMAMTSQSTSGKIAAMWLPILTFFAQGFEHSVVNMFAIPAGMMMGAEVSVPDWWLWNQIPVTLGNIVGGMLFTGMALQLTYRRRAAAAPSPA